MKEIRWHGRGGQGGFTASRLLGIAASVHGGKHALAFPSFGPERRGAPVLAFTKIDDTKIHDRSEVQESDFVVVMDETLIVPGFEKGIKENACVLINTRDVEQYREQLKGFDLRGIDATTLAMEVLGRPITNTAMYGALAAASGLVSKEAAIASIHTEMKPKLAQLNEKIVERAFELISQ
ncbi:pyruvate ferredoxin oxidoreductase [Marinifilum breve]|jgi:pyruvate ferredoxin oxidoreductase gamma subunit|uniref:Pyruvate ferredoxin oxidoreductase n=1 Tax=Marinifilum breve TaxID=2184082 RepID=A0A2V3ZWI8_9BACT|nr:MULTISPECIES: 2-oxoacid:acceptor oxidoreductase family protein [Marinifilum]MCY1632751.1 2-oxoacid:acceptor oxidoreductase family protein [Marinifilum sp. D737]MDQ2179912.1 2-oxoacid:acceptor oxidoreductase family protein [Marinifilum sp. D714]PXY00842.1 pyruvate ferredoxin oxidoreductase [Marinifilum breve]